MKVLIHTRCLSWNSRLGFWKNSQAIMRLQRRVIRRWNGNFVDFQGTFLKKCEKFSYKAKFAFFWQEAEMANADLKSNFKSRGCLRPIWPQTYVISYLSCIYCKEMVFFGHKLIRGHFAIDQILLQKQEFLQFSL